jgi:membrane associated rhomboid family serine protease
MDEIKASFKSGSIITRLIYINLAVFILVNLLNVIGVLTGLNAYGDVVIDYLAVPAFLENLIRRPWTIITYMFLHKGFLHILFNLLILYWFGKIFLHYLVEKQLLSVYILGGISGAILFILFYNVSPAFTDFLPVSKALGASASIMAIVIAISVYAPNYSINLLFIGPVKLKYIALIYVVLDFLQIAGPNAGGHLAHLGGALFGYIYTRQLQRGKDISTGFNRTVDSVVAYIAPGKRRKFRVSYKNPSKARRMNDMDYNKAKAESQEEVDRILDKIAESGYDSLTKREKDLLFKMKDKS